MGNVEHVTEPILVEKDSRGRIALGKVADAERYLVHREANGRIVLEPAVVMSAVEERLLSDPAFIARMAAAASEPASPLDLNDL
ncbi:MAG: hypothetical protein ACRDZN_17665 [Acidimicrobiales bacterium]